MASSPGTSRGARMFVVHQHDATRMHWDLRLEIDGVLCSWAVPKAPSLDPDDKRLAVKVENHPLEYVHFEAVIPDGNYGAGPMICWDRGCFRPLIDPAEGLKDGEIKFELYGYKLRGAFTLVHTGKGKRGRGAGRGSNDWLLIKKRDDHATSDPIDPTSVLTGLSIEEREHTPRHKAILAALAHVPVKPVGTIEPMLCQTADAAFSSDDWLFELKYDGFRLMSQGGRGRATLRYRSGLDSTERFPEIASALRAMPVDLVLDGEIVVLDAEGKPDFHKLAARAQISRASELQRAALTAPVTYMVFDVLSVGGHDLRNLPLVERKAVLKALMPALGPLRFCDHIVGQGEAFLAAVVARGLEGVVAKKANSPYRSTRSRDWLKMKRDPEADFAICGYTRPKGSRIGIGALHLCIRDGETWRYAGKVGSGFDDKELAALAKELATKPAWKLPFARPEASSDATWIEPELACMVRYREWPVDSTLRHPVFERMRRDKPVLECTMPIRNTGEPAPAPPLEADISTRELRLSNLKKVFWPNDGITKGDLIDYYRSVAPYMLPYLKDRPVVLSRYPDGIAGETFYQKSTPDWVPPWLRTTMLWSEHSQREVHYVMLDDADGLAFVANLASIPIHAWASRIHDLERPDWTIIDFDAKQGRREDIIPLALATHRLCEAVGLPNVVKTSGQQGLHVLIPLAGRFTFEQARTLAYLIGSIVEREHPDIATTNRNPAARGNRVYLDWGQNAHGQLLVAPYSVRPIDGAPVSMPLTWDEVTPELDPKRFHLRNALERISSREDPCASVLTTRPDLEAALRALEEHVRSK
jgi:bifunctional non-homologous end joining protein LigD